MCGKFPLEIDGCPEGKRRGLKQFYWLGFKFLWNSWDSLVFKIFPFIIPRLPGSKSLTGRNPWMARNPSFYWLIDIGQFPNSPREFYGIFLFGILEKRRICHRQQNGGSEVGRWEEELLVRGGEQQRPSWPTSRQRSRRVEATKTQQKLVEFSRGAANKYFHKKPSWRSALGLEMSLLLGRGHWFKDSKICKGAPSGAARNILVLYERLVTVPYRDPAQIGLNQPTLSAEQIGGLINWSCRVCSITVHSSLWNDE